MHSLAVACETSKAEIFVFRGTIETKGGCSNYKRVRIIRGIIRAITVVHHNCSGFMGSVALNMEQLVFLHSRQQQLTVSLVERRGFRACHSAAISCHSVSSNKPVSICIQ